MPLNKKMPLCEALKKDGSPCQNNANSYSSFCRHHATVLDRMDIPKLKSDDKSLFETLYSTVKDKNRLDALIAARKRQDGFHDLSDIRALLMAKILEIEATDATPNYKARDLVHVAEIYRRIAETEARIKGEDKSAQVGLDFSTFWKDSRFRDLSKKSGKPIEVSI